jgi:hypothetical protein
VNEPPTAAALTGVLELSLVGTVDAAPWRSRLAPERLRPAERDGRARVMIVAAAARTLGVRFRELSFSLLVDNDAAVLLQAFNSSRFFAWCERVFFSTPYARGRLDVDLASIRLEGLFRAERRSPPRTRRARGVDPPPRRGPHQVQDRPP